MDKRLQQFLTAENISQSQLADTLGVTRASISHILSGRNKPGFDFIESMAMHYPELNLEWLISGKGKIYKKGSQSIMQEAADLPSPVQNNANPELFSGENDQFQTQSFESQAETKPVHHEVQPHFYTQSNAAESKKPLQKREEPLTFATNKQNKLSANQKNISKIIIFYDDMSYEVFGK